MNGKSWSKEEVEHLKAVYPTSGYIAHKMRFPFRSNQSIRDKANKLGIARLRISVCSVSGCSGKHHALGLCIYHYNKSRSDYFSTYRKKNKSKINRYQRFWRSANPDKVHCYNIRWRKRHPDEWKEHKRRWERTHPEARRRYVRQNHELIRSLGRAFYAKNREKMLEKSRVLRMKRMHVVGSHTIAEWESLKRQTHGFCPSCLKWVGQKRLTRDHIVPIGNKGGTDYIGNIQPLCLSCNCSKGEKTIIFPQSIPQEDMEVIRCQEEILNLVKSI